MPVDIALIEDAWINDILSTLKTSLGLKMRSHRLRDRSTSRR